MQRALLTQGWWMIRHPLRKSKITRLVHVQYHPGIVGLHPALTLYFPT